MQAFFTEELLLANSNTRSKKSNLFICYNAQPFFDDSVKSEIHFWNYDQMRFYDAGFMLKNQGIECFLLFYK